MAVDGAVVVDVLVPKFKNFVLVSAAGTGMEGKALELENPLTENGPGVPVEDEKGPVEALPAGMLVGPTPPKVKVALLAFSSRFPTADVALELVSLSFCLVDLRLASCLSPESSSVEKGLDMPTVDAGGLGSSCLLNRLLFND